MANPAPQKNGGKPDKLIRDALKAAMRQDPRHLKEIAENWVERAKTDQQAANELANRIDGRVAQAIVGDPEQPLMFMGVEVGFKAPNNTSE